MPEGWEGFIVILSRRRRIQPFLDPLVVSLPQDDVILVVEIKITANVNFCKYYVKYVKVFLQNCRNTSCKHGI